MTTRCRKPSPAPRLTEPFSGRISARPWASMWPDMAEAPALVPPMVAPRTFSATCIAASRALPPIRASRRFWSPPVMKMPVAASTWRTNSSLLACWRVVTSRWLRASTPRLPKASSYMLHISSAMVLAAVITTMLASAPPDSSTKRVRISISRLRSSWPPMITRWPFFLCSWSLIAGSSSNRACPGCNRRRLRYGSRRSGRCPLPCRTVRRRA